MKNLTLRVLAMLMALLLVFGLAACGGNEEPNGESSYGESEVSTPEDSDEESDESDESDEPDESDESDEDSTTTTEDEDDETTTKDDEDDKTTSKSKKSTTKKSTTKKSTTKKSTTTTESPKNGKSWKEIKKDIPSSASGKTLTVVDWNPVKEMPGMDDVLEDFEKETGIKIDYKIVTYSTYFTKLTSQVTAKNAPDAARLQNPSRRDLTNVQAMNKLGYDFSDAAWDQNVISKYTFNGNIYGVNMTGSPYYSPMLMYYNTNLISTYNLDDPYEMWKDGEWTWDNVWDMIGDFTKKAKKDGDGYLGVSFMGDMSPLVANGTPMVDFDESTGTFFHNMANESFIKAFQEVCNMKEKEGYISHDSTNTASFDAGKLLFFIGQGIAARDGSSYFSKLREQGVVAAVPLPTAKKGAQECQILGEVQAFGVPKTAKNAELVPYFLRYYFDPANYDMDTMFNVEHAAEAIDYIRTTDPTCNYTSIAIQGDASGNPSANYIWDETKASGAENVKKIMDQYIPYVDDTLSQINAFFKNLK